MNTKMTPQTQHPDLQQISKSLSKKDWLKMIKEIDDPALCEAYIIQLEARKAQLKADFKSKTPRS